MAKGGGIALGWASPPCTVSQIPRRMFRCDAAQRDSLLLQPMAKTRADKNLPVNRSGAYPCSLKDPANRSMHASSKPSGARNRTTWPSMLNFTVNSFPLKGLRSSYYVAADELVRPKTQGQHAATRHSPEG